MKPKYPDLTPSEVEAIGRVPAETLRVLEAEAREAAKLPPQPAADAFGRATLARRRNAPPQLTGGEHRGQADAPESVQLVLSDGSVKAVMKRSGPGECGFIDWVNFTISESTAHRLDWPCTLDDADIVNAISAKLVEIVGFGVTGSNLGMRNFYQRTYPLGEGYGFLCHGGQRGTVLVMLSGTGVTAAKPGWEWRLKEFLETVAISPRLTRVDVAHDCFDGEYTVDQADSDFNAGLFRLSRSPRNPAHELRGNWREPDGKGRTICIGRRANGKYCRVYEKGRQLGAPGSDWTRIEVEYKGVDRVIPFDILTDPGAYLAGAYPAFEWVTKQQDRITTTRRQVQCSKEKKENWIQRMCGADLYVLHALEQGRDAADKALNLINRLMNDAKLPAWAKLPDHRFCDKPFLLMRSGDSASSEGNLLAV